MATRSRVVDAPRKRQAPQMHAIRVLVVPDDDPNPAYPDPEENDEFADRRAAHARGEFQIVLVRAEADVAIGGVIQTLTSGGMGGVESDSDVTEFAGEEWRELRRILTDVGVPTAELPSEVDPQWIEWRT
jgi:hypothetical protein